MADKYVLQLHVQEAEMRIITECWLALEPLPAESRYRALDWLRSWASDEGHRDTGREF